MFSLPEKVLKGWGFELWVANNDEYCGKILHVERGKRCSLHFHVLKKETFMVLSGRIKMTLIFADGTRTDKIMETYGDTLEITPGLIHQFEAIDGPANIMEVSTHHEDSDSYRVERGN